MLATQKTAYGEPEQAGFLIRTYGAKGDGRSNDTRAIQAAIDACYRNGGGTVFFQIGRAHV